jgi:hypothetical protein
MSDRSRLLLLVLHAQRFLDSPQPSSLFSIEIRSTAWPERWKQTAVSSQAIFRPQHAAERIVLSSVAVRGKGSRSAIDADPHREQAAIVY